MKKLALALASFLIFSSCDKQSNQKNELGLKNSNINTIANICEDSIEIASKTTPKNTSQIISENNKSSLWSDFEKLKKEKQEFLISASKDTMLVCKERTRITIKKNSFIYKSTGETVYGKIQITVREYYTISDMILAKLSTTSDGEILETGGMLHITAEAYNQKVVLKKGNTIAIGFPYNKQKPDMQLFDGKWENEIINWKLQNDKFAEIESAKTETTYRNTTSQNDSTNYEQNRYDTVSFTIFSPSFKGSLTNYINKNIKYPEKALKSNKSGRVIVSLDIDSKGKVGNINVVRTTDTIFNQAAINVFKNMPDWEPAKNNYNKPVSSRQAIPINFRLIDDGTINTNSFSSFSTEKFYNKDELKKLKDSNYVKSSLETVNQYIMYTSTLDWVNCDRFYRNNLPRIDYEVYLGEKSDMCVYLVFHSIKGIITNVLYNGNTSVFFNIPTNEKVTIVAIKKEKNQLYLAQKNSTTSKLKENKIEFLPVNYLTLEEELQKLNSIH